MFLVRTNYYFENFNSFNLLEVLNHDFREYDVVVILAHVQRRQIRISDKFWSVPGADRVLEQQNGHRTVGFRSFISYRILACTMLHFLTKIHE